MIVPFIEKLENTLNRNCLLLVETLEISQENFENGVKALIENGFENEIFEIQSNVHHDIKYFLQELIFK